MCEMAVCVACVTSAVCYCVGWLEAGRVVGVELPGRGWLDGSSVSVRLWRGERRAGLCGDSVCVRVCVA